MGGFALKRKRIRRLIIRVSLALLLLWLASSALAAWKLTRRERAVFAEPVNLPASIHVEEHRLKTSDQHDIGDWLIRGNPKLPIVLHLHSNGSCRYYNAPLSQYLAERGFGVLAISMRAHGDSSGSVNDFGYGARHDVVASVQFLKHEMPGRLIVIVGESLGAAAAIFSAGECAGHVCGYVLVSPYTDLSTTVWNRCDHFLYPPFSHAAYFGLRLWAPVFMSESPSAISPLSHIADIPANVPVTIFAGDGDLHVRLEESRTLQEKIRSHATLIIVHGGGHHEVRTLHETEYRQVIESLLSRVH